MRRAVVYTLIGLLVANALVFCVATLVFPRYADALVSCYAAPFKHFDYEQKSTYLAVLALCLLTEIRFLGWRRSSLRKLIVPSRSARHDLITGFLNVSGFSMLLFLFFTVGSVPVVPHNVREQLHTNFVYGVEIRLAQFVIWFVVADFLDYWHHRLLHKFRCAWEIHKYHHSATEFTMITGNRVHFLEKASRYLIVGLPLALLGTPVEGFVAILLVRRVIDIYQHSMVDWNYGWIGRWIVYSPIGHRIHHSALPEHWDKNFGNISPIWDRLFGTWYAGETVNTTIGVSDNYFQRQSVVSAIVTSYWRFFRELFRSLRTRRWHLRSNRKARRNQQRAGQGQPSHPHQSPSA